MAGCAVVALTALSGCGGLTTVQPGATGTSRTRTAPPNPCEVSPTVAPDPQCVGDQIQRDQQSNQMFNAPQPLPDSVYNEAKPFTDRVQKSLEALTPTQRLQVATVRSTLLADGVLSNPLIIYGGRTEVDFYSYEPFDTRPPVCANGELTAQSVTVNMSGITNDGSCAPEPGGH